MKIKWTNRFSGEQGYVKEIKPDHFINTFEKADGENFRSRREAEKAVAMLCDCGEGVNNEFEIVTNKD